MTKNTNETNTSEYSIKPLDFSNEETLQKAIAIYDEGLGQDYIEPEKLIHYAEDPNCVSLGSFLNDELVGVLIGHIITPEEITQANEYLQKYDLPLFSQDDKVALIKSIAVQKEHRRHGLATHMTTQAIEDFINMGCNKAFALSWVSNRPDSSPRMFGKLGFENLVEIKDYWTQDSIQKGYACPVCGHPCHCSAIYYLKTL